MSTPTLSGCMVVSGAAKWLPFTVSGLAPYVDELIIVEGAAQDWVDRGEADENGLAPDGTHDVLVKLAEEHDNIHLVEPKVYPHRNAQRQAYLDVADGDVIVVVDHDEFYHPHFFEYVREWFSGDPDKTICLAYLWWNFYTWTRRYPRRVSMERVFRRLPDLRYPDRNTGQSALRNNGEGPGVWKSAWETKRDDIQCFHYNRVQGGEELLQRINYYLVRDFDRAPVTKPEKLAGVDRISYYKPPNSGIYVPIREQPEAARKLILSGISPEAAECSVLDIHEQGDELVLR